MLYHQNNQLCHCGQPLHYSSDDRYRYAKMIIENSGDYAILQSMKTGKYYKVQRHYYLLHGVELKRLDELGFEEVKDRPQYLRVG